MFDDFVDASPSFVLPLYFFVAHPVFSSGFGCIWGVGFL